MCVYICILRTHCMHCATSWIYDSVYSAYMLNIHMNIHMLYAKNTHWYILRIEPESHVVYFAYTSILSRALIMGLLTYVSVHHVRFRTQHIFGNVSESVHCILACFYLCTHDQIYNKIMNKIDKRKHKMRYNVQAFSRIIQGWAVGGLDASKSGPSTLCFYGWSLELLVPFIRSSKSSIKSFSMSERHNGRRRCRV